MNIYSRVLLTVMAVLPCEMQAREMGFEIDTQPLTSVEEAQNEPLVSLKESAGSLDASSASGAYELYF